MLYTVMGLWVDDEPLIAGVIEGEHSCVDSDGESEGFQRWATSVEAADPDEAERRACAEMRGDDDDDDDDDDVMH